MRSLYGGVLMADAFIKEQPAVEHFQKTIALFRSAGAEKDAEQVQAALNRLVT